MCGHRVFQSLTRDSNHSNGKEDNSSLPMPSFNPSRGIAIIQTGTLSRQQAAELRFNPSRGIAIIQTMASAFILSRA